MAYSCCKEQSFSPLIKLAMSIISISERITLVIFLFSYQKATYNNISEGR
ncbi:MAG: hypothetical protein IJ604_05475 [Prevotella sp.]|nr:hypothetical protein [Prevotella sp.]